MSSNNATTNNFTTATRSQTVRNESPEVAALDRRLETLRGAVFILRHAAGLHGPLPP